MHFAEFCSIKKIRKGEQSVLYSHYYLFATTGTPLRLHLSALVYDKIALVTVIKGSGVRQEGKSSYLRLCLCRFFSSLSSSSYPSIVLYSILSTYFARILLCLRAKMCYDRSSKRENSGIGQRLCQPGGVLSFL